MDTPEDVGRSLAAAIRDALAGYIDDIDPAIDRVATLDVVIAELQQLREALRT